MNSSLRVCRVKHGFQRVYKRLLDLLTPSIDQSNHSPGLLNFQLTKSDHLTLNIASTQVVEKSVANNSSFQDSSHQGMVSILFPRSLEIVLCKDDHDQS